MKNKLFAAAVIALLMLSGCTRREEDKTKIVKAYIRMPDGTVTVENVRPKSYMTEKHAMLFLPDGRIIETGNVNVVLEEIP